MKKLKEVLKGTSFEEWDGDFDEMKMADEVIAYLEARIDETEVIYYSEAMGYLLDNDPSLQYSLQEAHNMGYTADKLNSELLATIVKQKNMRDELYTLTSRIKEIF